MDVRELTLTTALTAAEARFSALLMKQLVAALIANGALSRREVAGSLLRAEKEATVGEEDDAIIDEARTETAREAIREWSAYFEIEAPLDALRQEVRRWEQDGCKGTDPLHEVLIAAQRDARR